MFYFRQIENPETISRLSGLKIVQDSFNSESRKSVNNSEELLKEEILPEKIKKETESKLQSTNSSLLLLEARDGQSKRHSAFIEGFYPNSSNENSFTEETKISTLPDDLSESWVCEKVKMDEIQTKHYALGPANRGRRSQNNMEIKRPGLAQLRYSDYSKPDSVITLSKNDSLDTCNLKNEPSPFCVKPSLTLATGSVQKEENKHIRPIDHIGNNSYKQSEKEKFDRSESFEYKNLDNRGIYSGIDHDSIL